MDALSQAWCEYSGPGHRAKDTCSLLRFLGRTSSAALRTIGAPIFFAFAGDAHWTAERQAAEFGVGIGEYRGVVSVRRRVFQRVLPEAAHPQAMRRGVLPPADAVRGHRREKASPAQLTEDENVEISGRDLR